MDAIRLFKLSGRLNAFPRRCDLDENTLFIDSNGLVECDDFPCLRSRCHDSNEGDHVSDTTLLCTHFFLRRFWIERETGINLCGHSARNNAQNLLPKFD